MEHECEDLIVKLEAAEERMDAVSDQRIREFKDSSLRREALTARLAQVEDALKLSYSQGK